MRCFDVKKNIAIIIEALNGNEKNRLASLLSKKLATDYNVYLFLLESNNMIYEHFGKIVNIGGPLFVEYMLKVNKEKYNIDVAISFDTFINISNIRTQQGSVAIVYEDDLSLLERMISTINRKSCGNCYQYAGSVVVPENDIKSCICSKCGVPNDKIKVMPSINDCIQNQEVGLWLDIIGNSLSEKMLHTDLLRSDYDILSCAERIAIYGAGVVGKTYYLRLRDKYDIECFITTDTPKEKTIFEIPVYSIDEVASLEDYTIILGVSDKFKEDVINELLSRKMENVVMPHIWPLSSDYYLNSNSWNLRYELSLLYERTTGKRLDFNFIHTYNEKIQWLKIFNSTPQKSELADKYLVRDYVCKHIGDKYLVPLLGVWDSFDMIDFNSLPSKFALKCTHGSGMNEIVFDKNDLNYDEVKSRFDSWMNIDYAYMSGFEMHYTHITPRIIAESLLETDDGSDLKDYKVFVFHGKAKLIQVDIDRMHEHRRNLYTREWEYLPYSILYPTAPDVVIERPVQLEEMLSLAEALGKTFLHVRVDFYICDEKIYFGEMTFTHGSGMEPFQPQEFNEEMGSWIHLPEI